jgi:hypothetical protein
MKNVIQSSKIQCAPITLEDPQYSEDVKKKIAGRAYEIYERRGKVPNHDVDDWLEAESEVRWELH